MYRTVPRAWNRALHSNWFQVDIIEKLTRVSWGSYSLTFDLV